jgi:transglutaminase-like putative cysteine protease
MHVRVGFELVVESSAPTATATIARPRGTPSNRLLTERRSLEPEVPIHVYKDDFGNEVWRWTAPAGILRVRYDAILDVSPAPDPVLPDLPAALVETLPDDMLLFTLPSRYCPSDLVLEEAWRLFGATTPGWPRVQAICDWIHENITYGYEQSVSTTSGYDAYQNREGVCRDFAHIAIMFCRALNIPARYVCGYLPDIGVPADGRPMDFHAWFEAYLGGDWRTFDARHNIPRIGRVLIARGRDAVDTAIMTSYGDSRLTGFRVWAAEVDHAQTLDMPMTPGEEGG